MAIGTGCRLPLFPALDLADTTTVEKDRVEFVRCSGMHTTAVRDIVKYVTTYDGCLLWNPFSCIEFLIPAFTKGVPQHLEAMCIMHGEIAIYAALFMTLYVGAYSGGFVPPYSKHENMRWDSLTGYYLGIACGIVNIYTSILYRLASASMARESDALVFIYYTRHFTALNIVVFCTGTVAGLWFGLGSADTSMRRGDHCLDGSMSFRTWWYEWVLDDFPLGHGVFYAKGEPVKNPWAKKAEELGISRPSDSQDFSQATFSMFTEFMHGHFELSGNECLSTYSGLISLMAVLFLLCPLLVFFFSRNSHFYWLNCARYRGWNDPYDLSNAAKDYTERAKVGERLAARDVNGDSFVDTTESATVDDCVVESFVNTQSPIFGNLPVTDATVIVFPVTNATVTVEPVQQ